MPATSIAAKTPGLLAGLAPSGVQQGVARATLLLLGVFVAALGLKGFLLPNGFIDGGVTGIALLVSQLTGIPLSVLILVINIPFIGLGYYQLGPKFAGKTVDFILVGIEEYTGVTMLSFHSAEIRDAIVNKLHRGTTVHECTQGFGSHGPQHLRMEAVFTIVTSLEVVRLTDEITRIDPQAFVYTQSISDIKGGLIKKRALH